MTKEVSSNNSQWDTMTLLAQIGNNLDSEKGAINMPVYFSTTYQHPALGESTGYDYTRTKNPTREVLENALAKLENGNYGFATSSGMSAIQLVLSLFSVGSHFVVSRDLYGGSYRYFKQLTENGQFSFSYADCEQDFLELQRPETVAFFIETPTNPLMNEISVEKLAQAVKGEIMIVVDNTFLTPIFQQPLNCGADIVIHSATKYLGGHNDLLAGAVIVKDAHLGEQLAYQLNTTGAVLSPFDSWLLIRGLKTLGLRMERHTKNAQQIVTFLQSEPAVREVLYAGKGGMVSFRLNNTVKIKEFIQQLELFTFAESLGGVESLITYPTTQTHADIPEELRISYGLTNDLLRLSVGIEAAEDLIADLKQAFIAIK